MQKSHLKHLLVASFVWLALTRMGNEWKRRLPLVFLGIIIASGSIASARRTDTDVAIAGIIASLLVGRSWRPRRITKVPRGRLGGLVIIAIAGTVDLVPFLGGSKLISFLASGSFGNRISLIFDLPDTGSPDTGSLVGQGPATATQGINFIETASGTTGISPYASSILNNRTFLGAEGGLSKKQLELGIIGVVLYGAIFWEALALPIHSLLRLDEVGVAFTMLAIALGVVFPKGHQSPDAPLRQPLFWLAVGGIWGRMHATVGAVRAG